MSGFYEFLAGAILVGATVAGWRSKPRRCRGCGAMVRVRGGRHRHY